MTSKEDTLIVVTADHGTHVYKVHNKHSFEHHLTFSEMKEDMDCCDVSERQCVSGGDEGMVLWNIDTGATTRVLRTHVCRYVKFLQHPLRIMYHVWEGEAGGRQDEISIMDMCGRDLVTFNTTVNGLYPKVQLFHNYIITAEADGGLRVHDIKGNVLFVFVDELSLGFNAFFENPVTKTITSYNNNGRCYTFDVNIN